MKKDIWVGIRSIGRPQTVAVLTSVYGIRDMVKGIIIVGKLSETDKCILNEFTYTNSIIVRAIEGDYSAGEATARLLEEITETDGKFALLLDDDVMFRREDVLKCRKEIFGRDAVGIVQRSCLTEEHLPQMWAKQGVFEFYFLLVRTKLIQKFKHEEIELFRKYDAGGFDLFYLTWLMRLRKFNGKLLYYKDRPYHLYMTDARIKWRNVPLTHWDELYDRMISAKTFDEFKAHLVWWGKLMSEYNESK